MWSTGVILYILLCGVPPFWAENEQGIFRAVLQGNYDLRSDPWGRISDGAKDCVRRMLKQDPKERMTALEALNHPWVSFQDFPFLILVLLLTLRFSYKIPYLHPWVNFQYFLFLILFFISSSSYTSSCTCTTFVHHLYYFSYEHIYMTALEALNTSGCVFAPCVALRIIIQTFFPKVSCTTYSPASDV